MAGISFIKNGSDFLYNSACNYKEDNNYSAVFLNGTDKEEDRIDHFRCKFGEGSVCSILVSSS